MAETQGTTVDSGIIGKITMASIGCKPALVNMLKEGEGNELALARIYGTLDEVRYQDDKDKGQIYTYFVGSFEAVNMQDGDVYKSGKLFLPKGISELVEGECKKNPNTAIQFAFEVRSIKANNPAKYSYKVLPLVSPEKSDALAQLRERVMKAGVISQRTLTGSQRGTGPATIDGDKKKTA